MCASRWHLQRNLPPKWPTLICIEIKAKKKIKLKVPRANGSWLNNQPGRNLCTRRLIWISSVVVKGGLGMAVFPSLGLPRPISVRVQVSPSHRCRLPSSALSGLHSPLEGRAGDQWKTGNKRHSTGSPPQLGKRCPLTSRSQSHPAYHSSTRELPGAQSLQRRHILHRQSCVPTAGELVTLSTSCDRGAPRSQPGETNPWNQWIILTIKSCPGRMCVPFPKCHPRSINKAWDRVSPASPARHHGFLLKTIFLQKEK